MTWPFGTDPAGVLMALLGFVAAPLAILVVIVLEVREWRWRRRERRRR